MTPYDRLLSETAAARAEFLSIPLLARAVAGEVSQQLYVSFLREAYHHVRHTCALLALAASRTQDNGYRDALFTYIAEERGHDEWILADIAALGGDSQAAILATPGVACRAMVGYAYYAIDRISPYALLGMVHVLEGSSAQLAARAASALQSSFGLSGTEGVRYLSTHGALDRDHVAFFRDLVNGLAQPSALQPIVDCATVVYRLYGDLFRDLEREGRS